MRTGKSGAPLPGVGQSFEAVMCLALALSDKNIATINKILNERGRPSVEVRISDGKILIYRVSYEKIQTHKQEQITRTCAQA